MPFGLCYAVDTFQRLMDIVLPGMGLEVCLAYLDDVFLHSVTLEHHLEGLELLFQKLKAVTLKLKPSKCFFMQTSIKFLGNLVSKDGQTTDAEKTRLVADWPVQINLKQLRGFLSLAGYYRKFVKDFCRIATPLNDLMKKNCRFEWTAQCQAAFDMPKSALLTPPVLALPNDRDPFYLDTDACDTSIGAVLSQIQDGEERVIAYAGRTLSRNELNYCVARKELLSVIYLTKYFRQYLLSRKLYIRTEHTALSWLKRKPEPIGQNDRWMQILSKYDYDIAHRKGRSHANADALLRHLCLNKPSCTACHPEKKVVVRAVTATSVAESNIGNCQHFLLPRAADQSTDHQPPTSAGNYVTTT